jgi:hypothetical protein
LSSTNYVEFEEEILQPRQAVENPKETVHHWERRSYLVLVPGVGADSVLVPTSLLSVTQF